MSNDALRYVPPYEEIVQRIDEVYRELDERTEEFRRASGFKCPEGCGKCCMTDNVEASVIEFLPLAAKLWEINEAEKWMEIIHLSPHKRTCVLFEHDAEKPGCGRCVFYEKRGLICRVFGYTASKDKYSVTKLVGCRVMKEAFPENFEKTRKAVSAGLYIPLVTVFAYRLMSIDQALGRRFMPINQAIMAAIESIGFMRSMYRV